MKRNIVLSIASINFSKTILKIGRQAA